MLLLLSPTMIVVGIVVAIAMVAAAVNYSSQVISLVSPPSIAITAPCRYAFAAAPLSLNLRV